MPPTAWHWLVAPVGFLAAVALADGGAEPILQANVTAPELREGTSAELSVHNRAATAVQLANCMRNFSVPAGGQATVRLSGVTGFWIVPHGLAWDCYDGPFDLFYVAANFTGGAEPVVGVGYSLVVENTEEKDHVSEGSGASTPDEGGNFSMAEDQVKIIGAVAGVELTTGDGAVRCRMADCSNGVRAPAIPAELGLVIEGPTSKPSLRPQEYSSHHGGGHGGWGHHGGGGHFGWGHHHEGGHFGWGGHGGGGRFGWGGGGGHFGWSLAGGRGWQSGPCYWWCEESCSC